MNANQIGVAAGFAFVTAIVLYFAMQSTDDNSRPIPETQTEDQVMGMGVQAGMRVNAGTPLDCHPDTHFWSPGLDVGNTVTTVKTPHRYPAIPGGNISTVMHKGWSCFQDGTPARNDWFLNPPEAAVL